MRRFLIPKWRSIPTIGAPKQKLYGFASYCTPLHVSASSEVRDLCNIVTKGIGSLDDLEASLDKLTVSLTSSVVAQIVSFCKSEAHSRRLLRFFSWSRNRLDGKLEDKDFNYAIRVFAEMKDHTAIEILVSDLSKEGREMEFETFVLLAETLVKMGREDEALGLFKHLDNNFQCNQDRAAVTAIVNALCLKGHAKRAERVVWHHKRKISGGEACIYRSLLYGWTVKEKVKESRRILQEMKTTGIMPNLYCYNTFLRCLCNHNLKKNPSGLVPEALNVMMEMRSYSIKPTSISYNILLSCLGRGRRVKESLQILDKMKMADCSPDWISYYLVARVLYLTRRFGKGNQIVEKMEEEGLVPEHKFYYDLVGLLCGLERVNYALKLFERMKESSLGGYGPIYDVLIPKLCRGGNFEKGRELWDEAERMGIELCCSNKVLDASYTEVFKPSRKAKETRSVQFITSRKGLNIGKTRGKRGKRNNRKKMKNVTSRNR